MPPSAVLDSTEYLARAATVRRLMAEQDIAALIVTAGPNLTYLSGYPSPARALARPFVFVLPQSGPPTFIVHSGREFEARAYSWTDDIRTYARLSAAPVAEIVDALRDAGVSKARVAVEIGAEQSLDMPVEGFLELERRLPDIEFVDAGPVLWPARMRKSAAEIELLRRACAITSAAYAKTFAEARVGMTEAEIGRLIAVATIEEGGSTPFLLVTSGAGNYDYVSKGPSARVVEPGDFLWIDSGCSAGGYWSDFSRAAVAGRPTAAQQALQAAVIEATRRGIDQIRPGVPVAEVARACNEALARIGIPITSSISGLASRVGHGIGLVTTEPPNVAEDDPTILEAGMVISVEPGVATTFGTFHVEENVLVTPNGYDVLSTAPRELATIADN